MGGYNQSEGALKSVECYSVDKQEWKQLASMNVERINPGCCVVDHQHVYVFGGRSADPHADFFETIERLNVDLNLWSFLKVKLPTGLTNLFAFQVKKDYILVLGGITRVALPPEKQPQNAKNNTFFSIGSSPVTEEPFKLKMTQKIDRNVYLLHTKNSVWYKLKPLSSSMKVVNVILSGDCRFNCFLSQ